MLYQMLGLLGVIFELYIFIDSEDHHILWLLTALGSLLLLFPALITGNLAGVVINAIWFAFSVAKCYKSTT